MPGRATFFSLGSASRAIAFLELMAFSLLCVALFFVPFEAHTVKYAIFMAGACLLIAMGLRARRHVRIPYTITTADKALVVFFAAVLISITINGSFVESQKIFFDKFLLYALAFFSVRYTVSSSRRVSIVYGVFLISIACVGIDALAQYYTGFDVWMGYPKGDPGIGRCIALSGPFGRYNFFSGYLEIVVPFVVFAIFFRKGFWYICAAIADAGMMLFSWVYVFQRTTLLCVLAATATTVTRCGRTWAIGIISSIGLVLAFLPIPFWQRILSGGDSDRLRMWGKAITMFTQKPFFGHGLGGYERSPINVGVPVHAHNTYLELLAETGILGLAGFVYFIYFFVATLWTSLGRMRDIREKSLCAAFSAACISILFSAFLSTNIIVGIGHSSLFWICAAMAVTTARGVSSNELLPQAPAERQK